MGEIEFAVIKINGRNVQKLSKDEALQAFMDTSPLQIEIQQCKALADSDKHMKTAKPIVLSLRCSDLHQSNQESQTDFDDNNDERKDLDELAAAEADKERLIEEEHVLFDQCLAPEIDIEEVTLRKSSSNEQLGLSIIYSGGPDGSSSKTNSGGSNNGATTISTLGSGSEYNNENCTEVFISHIQADSVAWRDGRLRQGDQILQINGKEIKTKEETETLIAENNNAVTLLVSRYLYTDEDDFNDPSIVVDLEDEEDDDEEENDETYNDDDGRTERGDIYTEGNMPYENCPIAKQTVNLIRDLNNDLKDPEKLQSTTNSTVNIPAVAAGKIEDALSKEGVSVCENKEHLASISDKNRKDLRNNTKPMVEKQPSKGTVAKNIAFTSALESDTEHIYETIPEDSDEPFYCSPYESSTYVNAVGTCSSSTSVNGSGEAQQLQQRQKQRVAQWLGLMHSTCGQAIPPSGVLPQLEHEDNNSSSAYNTGGSNASAQQQMRNDALGAASRNLPDDNVVNNLSHKHFPRLKDKTNQRLAGFNTTVPVLGKNANTTRTGCEEFLIPDTLVRMYPPLNTATGNQQASNKKLSTRDTTPRSCNNGITDQMPRTVSMLCPHFNAPNLRQYHFVSSQEVSSLNLNTTVGDPTKVQNPGKVDSQQTQPQPSMVWKVKRRPDGTRYIVRRPAAVNVPPEPSTSVLVGRNRVLRNPDHLRNDLTTTEDDTISEVKTGRYWSKEERKKHVERARERRQQQQQLQQQQQQQLIEAATTIRISDKMVARLQQYRKQRQKQHHTTLKVQHQDLQFGGGSESNMKAVCELQSSKTLPQNAITKINPLSLTQQQHQFLNHSHSPGDCGLTTTALIPIEDINPKENCSSP